MSRFRAAGTLLVFVAALHAVPGCAATLERLNFDELTNSATDIVYGQVLGSRTAMENGGIHTHYNVQVQERWKGSSKPVMDVVLPGGVAGGLRQNFAGVPQLEKGGRYVMFLWTGPSGKTQLLGLTQGLFDVRESAEGESMASRGISSELMLDRSGKAVQDQAVRMTLRDMSTRVRKLTAKDKAVQ